MGPDSARSWAVAGACCLANCLLYGVARLSGLLMVAAVHAFHTSRARAALPFSVATSARNLSGVFVGHLGRRFGVRAVVCCGCLLASLGAGLCFFAPDVLWLTVCWGGLFGTGSGLALCLLPLAINQHFSRHAGAASGLSYSGSYVGSFVFPPLVVALLADYGLPGTFLIVSGAVLNVLAAAMLLADPPRPAPAPGAHPEGDRDSWLQRLRSAKTRQMAKPAIYSPAVSLTSSAALDQDHPRTGARSTRGKAAPRSSYLDAVSRDSLSKGKSRSKYVAKLSRLKQMVSLSLFMRKYKLRPDPAAAAPGEDVRLVSFRRLHCVLCTCAYHPACRPDFRGRLPNPATGKKPETSVRRRRSRRGTEAASLEFHRRRGRRGAVVGGSLLPMAAAGTRSFCAEWARLLGRPAFVVISLTMALYTFVVVCLITVVEDYAKDLRFPEGDVHYVLMALSAADLVGTLTLGVVTDRRLMSRRHFIALCFAGMGACSGSLSLCTGPASLLSCVAAYGLFEAGTVITFPVLMGEVVPLGSQAVAIASSNVLSAPTVLLVPLVIGHFRDRIGCYSGVFYLLGVTSLLCACLWLMVPLIGRALRREIRDIRRLSVPH